MTVPGRSDSTLIPGQMIFTDAGYAGTARVCAICPTVFAAKRSDAVYCSSACRQEAYRRRNGARPQHRLGYR